VAFLYVLFRFPGIMQYVKEGGAEPDVVVRLATFYHLNWIRVTFRFFFTIPLLILAIDALNGPYPIIGNPFALDFLLMIGGIGCFISSAITLLIFFPRSITRESGYKAKIISPQIHAKVPMPISPIQDNHDPPSLKRYVPGSLTSGVRMGKFHCPTAEPLEDPQIHTIYATESQAGHYRGSTEDASLGYESDVDSFVMASPTTPHIMDHHPQRRSHEQNRQDSSQTASGGRSDDTVWERRDDSLPNRRRHSDGVYNHHRIIVASVSEGHWSTDHEREAGPSQLHPFLINFTSPIDLLDERPLQHDDRHRVA